MVSLPTNVDATYADDPDNPSRKEHQQHHDALHAASWDQLDTRFDATVPRAGESLIYATDDAYGATFDGTTDDGPALQAALDAAKLVATGSASGAVVVCPTGEAITNQQLENPNRVRLRGAGRRSTSIKAGASFPTNTAVLRLGEAADTIVFGCRPEHLQIHCADVAGSIGIYSTAANEGCVPTDVAVRNYLDAGVRFAAGCSIVGVRDMELFPAASTTAGLGVEFNGVNGQSYIEGLSVVPIDGSATAGTNTDAVKVTSSDVLIRSLHAEGFPDAIHLVSGTLTVDGVHGNPTVTNLLHIDAAASGAKVSARGLVANGATNGVNDANAGRVIAGTVQLYVKGGKVETDAGALAPSHGARVYHSATSQNIPDNTDTAVTFDTERWDDDAFWDVASPTRLTIPDDGWYMVGGAVGYAFYTPAGKRFWLYVRRDGVTHIAVQSIPDTDGARELSVSGLWYFTAGQYVELVVKQNTGAARTLQTSGSIYPEFWIMRT